MTFKSWAENIRYNEYYLSAEFAENWRLVVEITFVNAKKKKRKEKKDSELLNY